MLFEPSQNCSPVVQSVDWEWHSPMAKATGQVHGGPMKCSLYVLMIQGAILESWNRDSYIIVLVWFVFIQKTMSATTVYNIL